MPNVPLPAPPTDKRHRQISQEIIVDMLIQHGFAYDIETDGRAEAEARCNEAIETWTTAGLGFARDVNGLRLFDPTEVICFMKWSGANGHDRFWEDRWIKTGRAFVTELSVPAGAAQYRVELKRTFDLRHFDIGAKVRLRLPLPLTSEYHPQFKVTPLIEPHTDLAVTQSEGRLEVRLQAPSARVVTIGADIELWTASPIEASVITPLESAEAELYLRPTEELVRVTPRVEVLAARLTDTGSALNTVHAFWAYMMETLAVGAIRYDEITMETAVDEVLEGGWCDCQLGSALFISLCRARGLPARMLGGHFLYRLAPMKHYWAEVWIDERGWMPFDCMSWDLSVGGRDTAWRDRFAGQIDHRIVTECLPRFFVGPMSVRFPQAWLMFQTPTDTGLGVETTFKDITDGSLIYRDRMTATRIG